ncbi:hypothetical protein ACWEKT_22000 [Nocardia takedensis]|uniref:hypothetical protein n=1 Tax=Nocardia takedensis TaxID=259390 RepID=UPI0002FA71C0|nr:hypothetical protein [Nocardia takedensis]
MTAQHRRLRRAGTGLSAFGAVAAIAVLTAPHASAWVGEISVSGTEHKVGCSYTITATVEIDRLTEVRFTDNGKAIPGSPVTPSLLSNKVTLKWTPETAGNHKIEARQLLISDSVTIAVAEKPASTGSAGGGCGGGLGGLIPGLSSN